MSGPAPFSTTRQVASCRLTCEVLQHGGAPRYRAELVNRDGLLVGFLECSEEGLVHVEAMARELQGFGQICTRATA